jgi:Rieske Fe-S protein
MTVTSISDASPAHLDRRTAVQRLACVLCGVLAAGCDAAALAGADPTTPPPAAPPYTLDGSDLILDLAAVPAFAAPIGALIIGEQKLIIWKRGPADFRAFNNTCTHSGCGIQQVIGERIVCQCHGSEFDAEGTNVGGPAPSPLTRYTVDLDGVLNRLRVIRPAA